MNKNQKKNVIVQRAEAAKTGDKLPLSTNVIWRSFEKVFTRFLALPFFVWGWVHGISLFPSFFLLLSFLQLTSALGHINSVYCVLFDKTGSRIITVDPLVSFPPLILLFYTRLLTLGRGWLLGENLVLPNGTTYLLTSWTLGKFSSRSWILWKIFFVNTSAFDRE